MSQSGFFLKPILISKEGEGEEQERGGGGDEESKPKKQVTFNRVVEYYTYSDNLHSWNRRLMPDYDSRPCLGQESKTCYSEI